MSSLCKAVGTSFRLGGGGGQKMLVSITSNPFVVIYQNNTILYSSIYVILVTTQMLAYFSLLLYTDQCIYCHFFLCLEKYAPPPLFLRPCSVLFRNDFLPICIYRKG